MPPPNASREASPAKGAILYALCQRGQQGDIQYVYEKDLDAECARRCVAADSPNSSGSGRDAAGRSPPCPRPPLQT